jgi:hypothetical protein
MVSKEIVKNSEKSEENFELDVKNFFVKNSYWMLCLEVKSDEIFSK